MAFALSKIYRATLYALACTLPTLAMAEETVVVNAAAPADTATAETHGYVATTSRGATKTDTPLNLTAQSVSVITRQQLEDQGASQLNDALNYTPGVFTGFGGGATRYDTIALRGFHGGDVDNVFLDGLRLMSDGGTYNVLQVDPWFLERIDVIRGPSSALYGQTVPGGLVMETSRRPQFAREGHLRTFVGNHASKGAAFDYTDAINENWAWRLTGLTKNTDTQFRNTRDERYAIMPSVLWQPDEDTALILRALLEKDPSGGFHGSVPGDGSLYTTTGRKLGTHFSDVEPGNDAFKRYQQLYSYEFTHRFNDIWAFRSNGSYTHSNVDLKQAYQTGWTDAAHNTLSRWYSGEHSSLNAASIDNQLEADFTTGPVNHTWVIGAEYHQYRNTLQDVSGAFPSLDPWTLFSGGSQVIDPVLTHGTRRYAQTGAYLQDQLEWQRWHLDLSGRYDHLKTDNRTVANATDSVTKNTRTDDHVSGRATLLYAFDNGLSPYVSYSSAITPQSLPGKDGTSLKPTTAHQTEVGLKLQPNGTRDLYTFAFYDLTQNDVGNRNIQGNYYEPAGKVHSQGIELEAHNQLTERLSTIAGYTWNKVRFEDAIDGNDHHTPYITPDSLASLWANYKADFGFSLGAGVRYIGKQWADNENTRRVPSVTLVDAMVRAEVGEWVPRLRGTWLQVNATNLTGRDYVAGCYGLGYCYWGQERQITATVGYDF